ncbi:patatin-like phospholipase family protein [Woodsholea maritima]|uniref:patatin-like phospholipase family protein n=1 Tax=Woodsholea maritima TaxID=240237 RepID=UPI00036868A2|nr:patatin-like phospholipase family protein [Woodsholea maritima]
MPLIPLDRMPFLRRVERAALNAVEDEVEWFCLPAGQILFEEGDPGDAFYLVRSGALAAFHKGADGRPNLVGHIRAGEPVGEMALVEDRPHSASVYALRDSEIMRLPKRAFDTLTRKHGSLMRELARMMLHRLRGNSPSARNEPKVFALIATSPSIDLRFRTARLCQALEEFGLNVLVMDESLVDEAPAKLDRMDANHDITLICATLAQTKWSKRAMNRADRVWILARDDAMPSNPLMPESPAPSAKLKLIDVVLLHFNGTRPACNPAEWAKAAGAARVFHWRQDNHEDVDHLARTITGRSLGLVLSGGGSRAYAHIGAIKALRQAGLSFDFLGGVSMGAIIAAGVAKGWDNQELEARVREAFVETNPLSDWTLPVIAMTKGHKVDKRLKHHFGEDDICDLPRPFFCISSNLTNGEVRVHRSGKLREALRASIAIPGLLPPVIEGQDVLVDGAVFNNFPAREMRAFHRGATIGCDVTRARGISVEDFINPPSFWNWAAKHGLSDPPPIASLLIRAATVGTAEEHSQTQEAADLLILPQIDMDLREWKRFDDAVEAGYRAASEALDAHPSLARQASKTLKQL